MILFLKLQYQMGKISDDDLKHLKNLGRITEDDIKVIKGELT